MLTISQNKQDEEFIDIHPIETERVNITEDEMLSMLYGVRDINNATLLIENSTKG